MLCNAVSRTLVNWSYFQIRSSLGYDTPELAPVGGCHQKGAWKPRPSGRVRKRDAIRPLGRMAGQVSDRCKLRGISFYYFEFGFSTQCQICQQPLVLQ